MGWGFGKDGYYVATVGELGYRRAIHQGRPGDKPAAIQLKLLCFSYLIVSPHFLITNELRVLVLTRKCA